MEQFKKLGIKEDILKALADKKFTEPSEIQEKAIPLAIKGKDLIAGSATGSGKTLAFGASILQNSEKGKGIQALIITPTRELAEQIKKAMKSFSKYKPLNIVCIYGGLSINPQIEELEKADIVVGTPGRILDHIERRTINLTKINTLVLDEADRMLEMGFIEDVEEIIKACNKKRQTLLFSATIPANIRRLAHKYMKDPLKIDAVSYVDPSKLKQIYYNVKGDLKFSLLAHLLKNESANLVMVFCNTRRTVDFVARGLKSAGMQAQAIHGGFTQAKRNKTMEDFHSKGVMVLVCTDVAARGLDIPGVSHVYNYDIPKNSKEYIHRIGRTARAGKEGIAINLLSPNQHDNFREVLRDQTLDIPKEEAPYVERLELKRDSRDGQRQGMGFRRGRGHGGRGRSGGSSPRSRFGNRRGGHRRR